MYPHSSQHPTDHRVYRNEKDPKRLIRLSARSICCHETISSSTFTIRYRESNVELSQDMLLEC